MYEVKKNGETIALVDKPSWIKRLVNGDMGLTTKEHATGIAISLGVFSLGKSRDMEDLDEVTLNEYDAGKTIGEHGESIAELEAAVCESDEANEAWKAEIEAALCEMDMG
jgi:hypothetical protein